MVKDNQNKDDAEYFMITIVSCKITYNMVFFTLSYGESTCGLKYIKVQ